MRAIHRHGFTLVELLVVVVVVGIIATIGFPQYLRMQEVSQVRIAHSKLEVMRSSMRSYFADFNTYAGASVTVLEDEGYISSPEDSEWDYSITPGAGTFTVTAQRTTGNAAYDGRTVTVDQDKNIGGTHPLVGHIIKRP